MWHDPFERRWGERLFTGVLSLFVVILALKFLAMLLTPLIPVLGAAVILLGLLLWFSRRSYW